MNIVYNINNLLLDDIVHIWKHLSRFKNIKINVLFFLTKEVDQHHLTSLIYKLDWMNRKGYSIKFEIIFKNQYSTIREYISSKYKFDYYIQLHNNVFFSNKFPRSLMNIMEQKQPFNINDLFVGFSNNDSDSQKLFDIDYKIIADAELANKQQPEIWIFNENECESFKNSWFSRIKENYLNGVELFYEYRS